MLNHNSAVEREETPHTTNPTQNDTLESNRCIAVAFRRRAESVLRDRSVDAQSRVLIRYALETNDPWLAELVRRVDAGEAVIDAVEFSQEPPTNSEIYSIEEKITVLAEMLCRAGDDSATKSAALLVLMAAVESSTHPKALANIAKHLAFTRCGELNLCGMVESQLAVLECELLSGNTLAA